MSKIEQQKYLQIQPFQVLQLGKADWQFHQLVCIQIQGFQALKTTKILWQLNQLVLAEIKLSDVGQQGEVTRQRGQQVVGQVDCQHLGAKLFYVLKLKSLSLLLNLLLILLTYPDWYISKLHHRQVQLLILQFVLQRISASHGFVLKISENNLTNL
jgi:hypothetical protein